ncbi:hypothetical protein T4D_9188 [Trichinella pseudospiralis]|uniref:Uncharacterized protein n=1 Tax=Trichinella pseudospiralis TaxID=6337 RepID=A0A0V1F9B5_TRIPS|nr:hypothetical protein T4D_9188 [Trichinella pseudospiralis]
MAYGFYREAAASSSPSSLCWCRLSVFFQFQGQNRIVIFSSLSRLRLVENFYLNNLPVTVLTISSSHTLSGTLTTAICSCLLLRYQLVDDSVYCLE